ncbi:unnamed protein product [Closterium sp. NIES-54]
MAYKEKEKAVWEAAAEVWSARTFSGFESFLEKDLHLFETHAAPNTPAPDAYLKELATDFMARGMARELMYHAVWIKRNRNSKARVTAKQERVRDEQARGMETQANPSTDLIALVKTLVSPLQQRVEALERRQSKSGPSVEPMRPAGKSKTQRRKEAKKNRALNQTISQQPTAATAPQTEGTKGEVTKAGAQATPAAGAAAAAGPAAIANAAQGAAGSAAAVAPASATTQPAAVPALATPRATGTAAATSVAAVVAAQPAPVAANPATLPRHTDGARRGRRLQAAERTSQPSAAAKATAAAVKVAMRGLKVNLSRQRRTETAYTALLKPWQQHYALRMAPQHLPQYGRPAMHAGRSAPQRAPAQAQQRERMEERGRLSETEHEPHQSTQLDQGQPAQTGRLPDTGPALDHTALQAQEAADRTQTALAQNAQQRDTPAQPALQAPMQPATSAYPFMAAPSFPSMYQQYPFAPMQPTMATGSHFLPHTHPFLFSQQAIPLQHTSAPAQPALSSMSVMPAAPAPPAYTYASTTPPPQQVAQGPQAQMAFGPPEGTGAPLNINYAPAAFGMPMRFLC